MILSIKTDADPIVLKYINETLDRLKNRDNPAKNPFMGTGRFTIKAEGEVNKLYSIINLDSFYFQVAFNLILFFLGGVLLVSLLMGRLYFPWFVILIGAFVLVFAFLTTNIFYYLVVYGALRKAGYKGPIEKISLEDFLKVAYFEPLK
jgi:pilus assembly protein TadC